MRSIFLRLAAVGALITALLGVSSQANATIYNIAADDAVGTVITLGNGYYRFAIIGKAEGGAYDSADVRCSAAGCANGWTNSFAVRDSNFATAFLPGNSTTVNILSVGPIGSTYGSAIASLDAYQAGPIDLYDEDINGGVVSLPVIDETVSGSPFIVDVEGDTYHFVVLDTDGGRAFDQGGVSLSISAIPEPASWALILMGFGGLGVSMRRRRGKVRLPA